jgi:hypothetical protein
MRRCVFPFAVLIALISVLPAGAARRLPADVEAFRRDRETCEHFMGEEAYDAERGAYIRKQIDRTCTGTDAKLAALRRKYAKNRDVLRALSRYDAKIER